MICEYNTYSPATNVIKTKFLFKNVISDVDKGEIFCSMDLKDIFLYTLMKNSEYMKVPYKYSPQDIREKYDLALLVHTDGYIYIQINKDVYGLKQAAILPYKNLSKLPIYAGYKPLITTSGLWKHETRKTLFFLYVDNFGIKYYSKDNILHLQNAINKAYTCKTD